MPHRPVIKTPSAGTLRKYGLTMADWEAMVAAQNWTCAMPHCRRLPESGRLAVDHEHVRGWKRMPPQERRRYVRGILCSHCNHRLVGRFMTLPAARAVVEYLSAYESRRGREWW